MSKERDLQEEIRDAQREAEEFEKTAHLDEKELAVLKADREERNKRIKGRADVQQALKVVEARRVLYRILEIAAPYRMSFDPLNARVSDFNEGRRFVGLEVLNMLLDADSGAYIQLINEHASDIKAEEERKRKENLK